jgi:hypothetical protein
VAADVVIRIRPDAYRATFAELGADIDRAVAQLQRWRTSVPNVAAIVSDDVAGSQRSDT